MIEFLYFCGRILMCQGELVSCRRRSSFFSKFFTNSQWA